MTTKSEDLRIIKFDNETYLVNTENKGLMFADGNINVHVLKAFIAAEYLGVLETISLPGDVGNTTTPLADEHKILFESYAALLRQAETSYLKQHIIAEFNRKKLSANDLVRNL